MRGLKVWFALLALALGGMLAAGTPPAAAPDGELLVIATASNRGEVDPCG